MFMLLTRVKRVVLNRAMEKDKDKVITKGMLDNALDEMTKTVLNGMDNLFRQHEKRFDEMDKRFDGIDNRFVGIDSRLEKIESEVYFMRQDIKDIKESLADTPTREEFNRLKLKVNLITP